MFWIFDISQTIHAVVLITQCMMSSPEVMHHCACVLSFMSWFNVNIDTKHTWCRLVWNRIWAVLSDFFVNVCCHQNLNIAIYAVDSLRQLAMKFLERDELANYSFQNDFMKPFVIVMRQSKAVEIRELIIRCGLLCSMTLKCSTIHLLNGYRNTPPVHQSQSCLWQLASAEQPQHYKIPSAVA